MKWYTVEDDLLSYLRKTEERIPKIDYGNHRLKPFFGALFEVDDLIYVTQVSSLKPRHSTMKEDLDLIKLYDGNRLIAVVNLNYMFPVPKRKYDYPGDRISLRCFDFKLLEEKCVEYTQQLERIINKEIAVTKDSFLE